MVNAELPTTEYEGVSMMVNDGDVELLPATRTRNNVMVVGRKFIVLAVSMSVLALLGLVGAAWVTKSRTSTATGLEETALDESNGESLATRGFLATVGHAFTSLTSDDVALMQPVPAMAAPRMPPNHSHPDNVTSGWENAENRSNGRADQYQHYRLDIQTANFQGAGTDGDVWVHLHNHIELAYWELKHSGNQLEAGDHDSYYGYGLDVDKLPTSICFVITSGMPGPNNWMPANVYVYVTRAWTNDEFYLGVATGWGWVEKPTSPACRHIE